MKKKMKMKKTISIVFALALTLALVLTLAAGCSSKAPEPDQAAASEPINVEAGANNNRTGNDGDTAGWPAAYLPQGFPVYPDGVVAEVDGQTDDGIGMTIEISGTNEATYNAYLKTLESAGWATSDENMGMVCLIQGSWVLWIGYGDPNGVIMYIIDNDYNVQDWPAADLPPGFPAYPGGKVTYIDYMEESGLVYIEISETDEAGFSAYLQMLEAAGWTESRRDGFEVEMDNGNFWLTIDIDNFGTVMLGVMEIGSSFDSDYEWPMGLPYDLPEYPDGDIILVRIGDDDSVSITVNNTTLENFNYYADTLTKSGWTITSTDSSSGEDVFMVYMFDYEDGGWSCAIDLMDAKRASIRTSISE